MACHDPLRALREGGRVLQYLKRTADLALHYRPADQNLFDSVLLAHCSRKRRDKARISEVCNLAGFGDANFHPARSTTGVLVKLFGNTVAWRSKRQNQVAKSTADSEVTAMATTAYDVDNMATVVESLGVRVGSPLYVIVTTLQPPR